MTKQALPYHTYLLINGDWLYHDDYPTHDAAYRSGDMNCKLFADVRDFKVVETLNYDQPQPLADTQALSVDIPEYVYTISWTSAHGFYGKPLNETQKMSGYNRYDAIDRFMNIVENRYHLHDVEITAVTPFEFQAMPTVTLDDIEAVQPELFYDIVVQDTYLEYLDYTQDIPAFITADTLPELVDKLSAKGFVLDSALTDLVQAQESERVPNGSAE